jgi:hypothetical protein
MKRKMYSAQDLLETVFGKYDRNLTKAAYASEPSLYA